MRLLRNLTTSHHREYIAVLVPAVLLALAGFWVAYTFVEPAPPNTIVIASGREDGAYHLFAQRYREILARSRVTLEVRSSAGSMENLERLRAETGGTDVAFVQGGTTTEPDAERFYSLGSLYYEPVWVFHRGERRLGQLDALRGKRIAVGATGSGTQAVALYLLSENRITRSSARIVELDGGEAAAALKAGRVDVAFFIASPHSPVIQDLLRTHGIKLMSFDRADAYTRRHPYLSKLTLPRGVIDLGKDLPASDTVLLAATAQLVVRRDFHPALIDLLLQTAGQIHGSAGFFEQAGEFPTAEHIELPLSPDAARYYKRGPSFLQRYLPFWAATFVDRMLVMLWPLLALVPLFRFVSPLYRWRVRKRIYRWYRDVNAVDRAISAEHAPSDRRTALRELDRIENAVREISIPLSYTDQLYNLRSHIRLVRGKLAARGRP